MSPLDDAGLSVLQYEEFPLFFEPSAHGVDEHSIAGAMKAGLVFRNGDEDIFQIRVKRASDKPLRERPECVRLHGNRIEAVFPEDRKVDLLQNVPSVICPFEKFGRFGRGFQLRQFSVGRRQVGGGARCLRFGV